MARLLNNLGVEYLKQGNIDEAFKHLTKSLLLFEEEHAFEQDFPTNNLAIVEIIRGNHQRAKDLLNIALNHHSEEFNRISILTSLAYLETRIGDRKKVREYTQKIIDALDHFFDPRLKEECLINISIIYEALGDTDYAFNWITRALSIDTTKKKDDILNPIKIQILNNICKKIEKNGIIIQFEEKEGRLLSRELPPLFDLAGYHPTLLLFYY